MRNGTIKLHYLDELYGIKCFTAKDLLAVCSSRFLLHQELDWRNCQIAILEFCL